MSDGQIANATLIDEGRQHGMPGLMLSKCASSLLAGKTLLSSSAADVINEQPALRPGELNDRLRRKHLEFDH